MSEQYYDLCIKCEHLYHCFGREVGEMITNGETEDMYLRTESCKTYYPERRQ